MAKPTVVDRIYNAAMLRVLNGAVSTFLRHEQERHGAVTRKAHAEARGTGPWSEAGKFDEFLAKASFTMLVFYRGLW